MINVTKTFFPPIQDFNTQIERVWKNEWLTNRGDLILELEEKLKTYLSVDNILILTNGTIPIQIALKLLGQCGDVITTPFSYVATTSSIIWENCSPVFVDIDPIHLTIDENKIEESITKNTTAILATHVFGNPCHVIEIARIAKKYNLKVIYDAAHCFGVKLQDQSIFNFGDVSTCSFHATKLFHTGEGGAVFCNDKELAHKVYYSHNFGHNGPLDFHGLGINGKISELQAAMGLSVFNYIDHIIDERRKVVEIYNRSIDFEKVSTMKIRESTIWNYSYYPILFKNEEILLEKQRQFNAEGIFPRRYFYPSLNTVSYVKSKSMPVSESIASRVLCLPLYVGLAEDQIAKIVKIINN